MVYDNAIIATVQLKTDNENAHGSIIDNRTIMAPTYIGKCDHAM